MGFYIRKSIRLGPVRFNLSKSGVGASIGVKGLRIGSGPRGHYIHAGRSGFYYSASLPTAKMTKPAALPSPNIPPIHHIPSNTHDPLKEIDSGDVLEMVDASSASLLEELNHKRRRIRYWPLAAGLTVAIGLLGQGGAAQLMVLVGLLITAVVYHYDHLRKTVVLFYNFEPERESLFSGLHDAFKKMITCNGSWHTDAEARVRDRKYHAGATSVIKRSNITLKVGQPPFVKTNIDVPIIPAGKQTLYFFPDRLLVFGKGAVGAVSYDDLKINIAPSKFVEDGTVPRDAEIVDRTWRYVNKKGGPDKRFKGNRELPIALYEEAHFQSSNGLNEIITLSRRESAAAFRMVVRRLAA